MKSFTKKALIIISIIILNIIIILTNSAKTTDAAITINNTTIDADGDLAAYVNGKSSSIFSLSPDTLIGGTLGSKGDFISTNTGVCVNHSSTNHYNYPGIHISNIVDINVTRKDTLTIYGGNSGNDPNHVNTITYDSRNRHILNALSYTIWCRYNNITSIDRENQASIPVSSADTSDAIASIFTHFIIPGIPVEDIYPAFKDKMSGVGDKAIQKYALDELDTSKTYYKARMILLSADYRGNNVPQQETAVFVAEKVEAKSSIYIQKQDSNGNNLSISGIKYKVYDSSGKQVGKELITDENGKTETISDLTPGTYKIKETLIPSSAYGYDGNTGNEITTTINSGQNIVNFKNTQNLTWVQVKKIDIANQNKVIPNAGFKIRVDFNDKKGANSRYLKISKDGQEQNEIIGDVEIEKNNGQSVQVSYVKENDATIFYTNSSGTFKISNLEKYFADDNTFIKKEFSYVAIEVNNRCYGYKGNADIEVALTKETTTTIGNTQTLIWIGIKKVNSLNTNEVLSDVGFKIKIEDGWTIKYLQISKDGAKQDEIKSDVTIDTENGQSVHVDYVSDQNDATTFYTKSDGIIWIDKLEKYYAKDKEYKYTAIETYNSHYGYKGSPGTEKELLKNEYTTVGNTQTLIWIGVKKVNSANTNEVLSNVGFKIKIEDGSTTKYLQISKNWAKQDEIKSDVTVDTGNGQSVHVDYISDQNNATTFYTKSDGIIWIDKLEKYYAKDKEYKYTAIETYNSHYGYKENPGISKELLKNEYTTVENTKTLVWIGVQKVNSANTNEVLPNVGFKIRVQYGSTTKYLKISKYGTKLSTITGGIYVDTGNGQSIHVDHVEENDATIFYTNNEGKMFISNLEKYYANNQEYIYVAKEIYNPNYGYKGNVGTEKTLIQNTDPKNGSYTKIQNTKSLTWIGVNKIGNNNEALFSVGFKIKITYGGTTKYLQISKNGKVQTEITTDVNVDSGNGKNVHVEYVNEEKDATIFYTKSNGKFYINYLEKYYDKEKEYIYTAIEVYNPHYGFKGNAGVTQKLTNHPDTVRGDYDTITNLQTLTNIEINKVGSSNEVLPDVEFKIQVKGNGTTKYLKITRNGQKQSTITGTVEIHKYNDSTIQVAYVEESDATVFKTNNNGTIKINNLEYYCNGNKTEYTYIAKEITNPNYGYKANAGKITTLSKGTVTKIQNTQSLTWIGVNKIGNNNEILFYVGFKIKISYGNTTKYLQISKNGNIQTEITNYVDIDSKNGKNVHVEYVDNEKNATIFYTDQTERPGKFYINYLEKYYDNGKEYIYTAVEVSNPHYGFKGNAGIEKTLENHPNTKDGNYTTIENKQILTYLEINKVGSRNEVLPNVEFKIQIKENGATKYIKITNNGQKQNLITDETTINKYNASGVQIHYVEENDATIFRTNGKGVIKINNLESYYGGGEYTYSAKETYNPNYGYKAETEIVTGLLKGKNTQIKNKQSLTWIGVNKIGDSNEILFSVGFKIQIKYGNETKYLQISENTNIRNEITTDINIDVSNGKNIHVEYISDKKNATIFYTKSNGKFYINNLEKYYAKDKEYEYTAIEVSNPHYGFKGNIGITQKLINNPDTEKGDYTTIINKQKLTHIEINKIGDSGEVLPNVEFKIPINGNGTKKYLKIIKDGQKQNTVIGEIEIHRYNDSTIRIAYVEEKDATIFKTNNNGIIKISNLEYYCNGKEAEYTYSAEEIYNPNYGYKGPENNHPYLIRKEKRNILVNTATYGKINITKVDSRKEKIPLSGMKFRIQVKDGDTTKYIKLTDKRQVTGITEIKKVNPNIIYVDSVNDATLFITDQNGITGATNLEVFANFKGNKYTYILEEADTLSHYGYIIDDDIQWNVNNTTNTKAKNVSFELSKNEIKQVKVLNTQKFTKISGYIWNDIMIDGKEGNYNHLYKEGTNDKDKLLDNIKVELYDKNNKLIETKYTKNGGNYTFGVNDDGTYTYSNFKISIVDISKYYIVFTYNGMKYTSCNLQVNKANGSKAAETTNERTTFNNNFTEISAGAKKASETGTSYGISNNVQNKKYADIQYKRTNNDINSDDYYKSQVNYTENLSYVPGTKIQMTEAYGVDKYHIRSTTNGNYTFTYYPTTIQEIDTGIININQGIVEREQVDLAVTSDLENVVITTRGEEYKYNYAKRNYSDNLYTVGVKYNQNKDAITGINSKYSRTVYPSDVIWHKSDPNNNQMDVYVTYKIIIKNQSTTLNSKVSAFVNYYDTNYTITNIEAMTKNNTNSNKLSIMGTAGQFNSGGNGKYNSALISLNGYNLDTNNNNFVTVYITYKMNDETVLKILDEETVLNNISEIYSYKTTSSDGKIYASIDKDSAPGNTIPGIKETYEDDTDRSPAFVLSTKSTNENRETIGTIFRDDSVKAEDGTRNGNGIFDNGEHSISGVKVELIDLKTNKVAKVYNDKNNLSGEDAVATTGNDGNYSIVGIIPGDYILKYTYTNGNTVTNTNEKINVYDYKGTIYVDNVNRQNNQYWYLDKNNNSSGNSIRYSDAIDDYNKRISIDSESNIQTNVIANQIDTNKKTYGSKNMEANTPKMKIGLEITDDKQGDGYNAITTKIENIDFGIVDRAKQNLSLIKEVANVKLTLGNGNVIVDGKPSQIINNEYLQYIPGVYDKAIKKQKEAYSKIVLDTVLMQSAQIDITYSFKVKNNSEIDYGTKDYYIYGKISNAEKSTKMIAINYSKIIDYIDNEMTVDFDINTQWNKQAQLSELKDSKGNNLLQTVVDRKNIDDIRKTYKTVLVSKDAKMLVPGENANSESKYEIRLSKIVGNIDKNNEAEYDNSAEILEIGKTTVEGKKSDPTDPNSPTGGATITYDTDTPSDPAKPNGEKIQKTIIPGKYEPGTAPTQTTEDIADKVSITPPTGENKQIPIYIGSAIIIVLSTIALGLIIKIKKKKNK